MVDPDLKVNKVPPESKVTLDHVETKDLEEQLERVEPLISVSH